MLNRQVTKLLIIVTNLFLVFTIFFSVAARTPLWQEEKSVLSLFPTNALGKVPVPIEFSYIKMGSRALKLEEEFDATVNSDWPKHLEFEIKNVSDKVITHFKLSLFVPFSEESSLRRREARSTPDGGRVYGVSMYLVWFGADTRQGHPPTERLLPGESIYVKVAPRFYEGFEERMRKYNLLRAKRGEIQIDVVQFDDKTYWYSGGVYPLGQPAG
jgi:hypothetical protein